MMSTGTLMMSTGTLMMSTGTCGQILKRCMPKIIFSKKES